MSADAVAAPLDGVRVVELCDESAEYCGRLLAGLGADVVKLEPPDGAPSRHVGPFLDDRPDLDTSLAFWADNVGKRSVVVTDDAEALALCAAADVVVHTLRPSEAAARGLDPSTVAARSPDLVLCALTPFGQDGPWADYLADDLVLMALGGSMAACGYGPGADGAYDTPPLASHGDQAWRTASTYAAIAVLGALAWRGASGQGQFIDVSAHECSASMTEWHLMTYLCSGFVHRRGPHPTLTAADGRQVAALNPDFLGPHVFTRMLEMLEAQGVAGALSDPAFADPVHRAQNYREVWRALKRLAEKHDGETLYRLGQSAGLPWGVIRSPEEVLDDRHLRARGHFVSLEHPELGRSVTYAGAPFLAHDSPWVMRRRPPLLGEHDDEVRAEWAAAAPLVTTDGRSACLVGVGETRYAKWGGITDASEYQLAIAAILAALADAGLSAEDVDGLSSFAEDRNDATFVAADLGIPELRYAAMSWLPGGGGACAAVANAAMAVETGAAEVVVVYRSLCQGQFRRFGRGPGNLPAREGPPRIPHVRRARSLLEAHVGFTMPFGMFGPPIAYSMVLRRHMHLFGTTAEHMGHVALTARAHAQRNPRAVMGDRPLTMEDYLASRWVAEPFRLFDCCLENDGACAVVVTTAERAADMAKAPVAVLAGAQGTPRGFGHGQYSNVGMPDEDYASAGARPVAARLWARAGLGPSDIDVAQVYDHFTGLVLLSLEDFGFCGRGEGGPYAATGVLSWPDGALPTNTHGGSLSEAYIHGLNHVVEGVRQLRGESTCQVPDAKTCLVTSAAGVPTSALVLGRR